MWHLMPSLSVRSLIQLNCPTWNMWDPITVDRIAQARIHDDTRDWYFPIIFKRVERWNRRNFKLECWNGINIRFRNRPHLNSPELSWSWSGIFHSDTSAQGVSDRALPLSPLTHLPHEWERLSLPGDDIIASAGGLLLIKSVQGAVPARRSSRLNGQLTLPAAMENRSGLSLGHSFDWKRLLVCNPLTRECRELPAASHLRGLMFGWENEYRNGVQATMVVDEHRNCYQVVLTFDSLVAVYKSTTNAWRCLPFQELRPWAAVTDARRCREWDSLWFWAYHCARVHTRGGRLFFAEVEPLAGGVVPEGIRTAATATPVGDLRLFEVDTEVGTWELVHEYTVLKFHVLFLNRLPEPRSYDMNIQTFIELVECMDGLYVVYPAKLHDTLLIGQAQLYDEEYDLEAVDEFMPIVFYIILLQGEGTYNGVLRIQVPQTTDGFQNRHARLEWMASHQQPFYSKFFRCSACGSTIWVSILDYVLSYNVVSQEATTKIISLDCIEEEALCFAYRPSLHMRP